jgi:hypothetical protein
LVGHLVHRKERVGAARTIASTYDRVGFLLHQLDDSKLEDDLLRMHGDVIFNMWKLIGRLVIEEFRTPEIKRYAVYFEDLALKASKYEESHPQLTNPRKNWTPQPLQE